MSMTGNLAHCCVLVAAAALLICVGVALETPNSTAISVGFATLQRDQAGDDSSQRVGTTAKDVDSYSESRVSTEKIAESATSTAVNLAKRSRNDGAPQSPLPLETAHLVESPLPLASTHFVADVEHQIAPINSIERDVRDALDSLTEFPTRNDYQEAFKKLIEKYGDYELATILAYEKSKDGPNLRAHVQLLEKELLEWWREEGKSVDDVANLLGLEFKSKAVFINPFLQTWKDFILVSEHNPVQELAQRIFFDNKDKNFFLREMFGIHQDHPVAQYVAAKLMLKWRTTPRSVSQVLEDLIPDANLYEFLGTPEFRVWYLYALSSHVNPWVTLVEFSIDKKSRVSTAKYIHQEMSQSLGPTFRNYLELAQFQLWRDEHNKQGIRAYEMLKGGDGDIEKDSVEGQIWDRYADYLRKLKRKGPDTSSDTSTDTSTDTSNDPQSLKRKRLDTSTGTSKNPSTSQAQASVFNVKPIV